MTVGPRLDVSHVNLGRDCCMQCIPVLVEYMSGKMSLPTRGLRVDTVAFTKHIQDFYKWTMMPVIRSLEKTGPSFFLLLHFLQHLQQPDGQTWSSRSYPMIISMSSTGLPETTNVEAGCNALSVPTSGTKS